MEDDKLPPFDLDAERATIGSMLMCGDDLVQFARIRRKVWRDAFYQPDYKILYTTFCRMVDDGKPLDAVTVRADLDHAGILNEIGGAAHIGELLVAVPSASNGEFYAQVVADRARERELIRIGHKLIEKGYQAKLDGDVEKVAGKAIEALWRVASAGKSIQFRKLSGAIERFIERRKDGGTTAMLTGMPCFDANFAGIFRYGGYTLVAGRPSMGKSTFIRWLLSTLTVEVALIALEEDEDKIAGNYLSAESQLDNDYVAYGNWSSSDLSRIREAWDRLAHKPLYITDAAFDLDEVSMAIEMAVIQHKCRVVAVDHIHLVTPPDRSENREQQIQAISQRMKMMAKKLNIVLIVAAQLSRPPKHLTMPPPPHMSDLRASGSLEEHADSILMLHRDDYYRQFHDDFVPNNLCQVLIPKNRNGCTGDLLLQAHLKHQHFKPQQPAEEECPV